MPKRTLAEWRANCVERRREKLAARKREKEKQREVQVQQAETVSDDQVGQESRPFPNATSQAEVPQLVENEVSGVSNVSSNEQAVVPDGQIIQESQPFPDTIAQAEVPQQVKRVAFGVANIVKDEPIEPTSAIRRACEDGEESDHSDDSEEEGQVDNLPA